MRTYIKILGINQFWPHETRTAKECAEVHLRKEVAGAVHVLNRKVDDLKEVRCRRTSIWWRKVCTNARSADYLVPGRLPSLQ